MAYTPELSYRSSCTLRRIAWALNIPMTKASTRILGSGMKWITYYWQGVFYLEEIENKSWKEV